MHTAALPSPFPPRDTQQVEVEPSLLLGPWAGSMGAAGCSGLALPRPQLEGRLEALLWKREQRRGETWGRDTEQAEQAQRRGLGLLAPGAPAGFLSRPLAGAQRGVRAVEAKGVGLLGAEPAALS